MRLDQLASRKNYGAVVLAVALSLFAAGCKKKVVAAPPPPPPPVAKEAPPAPKPAAPVVSSFAAEPTSIERGQASTLRWNVSGETTEVRIEPALGVVNASGSRQVFPGNTTTYTLTANGPGGSTTQTATVNVTTPTPPAPPRAPAKRSISDVLSSDVQDAFFDYDQSTIREDARSALTRDADVLKGLFNDYPNATIVDRRPRRRARLGRIQSWSCRPSLAGCERIPRSAWRKRGQAETCQLRQGTSAVHRIE